MLPVYRRSPLVRRRQRSGGLRDRPEDAGELAALQELASLATPPGDLVLGGADGLLGAAARFHGQQVPIAGRRDEAEYAIVVAEFNQEDALARSRQVIHLIRAAQESAATRSRSNEDFSAGQPGDTDDFRPLRGTRIAATGPRAR